MSNIFNNASVIGDAVSSLASALHDGAKAEGAIRNSVRAVGFMALEQVGRDLLSRDNEIGAMDPKDRTMAVRKLVKERTGKAFDFLAYRLVNKGKPVYRDSDAVFVKFVQGKKDNVAGKVYDRSNGVRAYFDCCRAKGDFKRETAKDYVWTVAQVRALTNKMLGKLFYDKDGNPIEDGLSYARAIARMDGDKQFGSYDEYFGREHGKTYGDLLASFATPRGEADPNKDASQPIIKAIEKLKGLVALRAIEAALKERIEAEERLANAAKAAGMGEEEDGEVGAFDHEVTASLPGEGATPEAHIVAPKDGHKPAGKTAH